MENLKLVHQLFIGKVADEIGMERTIKLLSEAKEEFATPTVVGLSKQLVCPHCKGKGEYVDTHPERYSLKTCQCQKNTSTKNQ